MLAGLPWAGGRSRPAAAGRRAGPSTSDRLELARRLAGRLEPGVALLEADGDLLAGEPARQELGLEPDQVVDEDDVVDQQLGQLQVAGRLGAPQADRVERHPLPRGELGRLGERLAVGRLAVGQEHDRRGRDAAELGQDLADAVAQPGLAAVGLDLCAASRRAGSTSSGVSTSASSRAEFETR